MINRLFSFFKLWGLWVLFFIFCRVFFILYNASVYNDTPIVETLLSFIYGFKLDLSFSGYIMFFYSLVFAFLYVLNDRIFYRIVKILNKSMLFIFVLIMVFDAELYRNWGYRMDSSVFFYLKTPKEAMASSPIWMIFMLLAFTGIFTLAFNKLFYNQLFKRRNHLNKIHWLTFPVFIFVGALMILPIRGGVGIAPINVGTVFFSKNQQANHAAINVHWNFGKSLTQKNANEKVKLVNESVAKNVFDNLLRNHNDSINSVLLTPKPNVVIIVLESFTAEVIEVLGGVKGVTPNLNALSKEGLLFSNCYANGDRSDKGLVSILSGYPAQPTTSIIAYPGKSHKLPHLSKKLHDLGYSSSFFYGGEINFANLKSYFLNGQYQKMITLGDFSKNDLNSKWGAHDHVVFNRFLSVLNNEPQPFYSAFFTLSSHEPFDVPHKSMFFGISEREKFLNAIHYTDSCLGSFVKKAKESIWWNNTLLVCIADHATRHPNNYSNSVPQKYRIPMLWLGGALAVKDSIIEKEVMQVDLTKMLGNQLGFSTDEFIFGKDVLQNHEGFACYAFKNGFGYLKDSTQYIYNLGAAKEARAVNISENEKVKAKAYMQMLLNDFNYK